MKLPKLNIGWLMAIVAVLALDFGAIRAIGRADRILSEYLFVGTMPLANILAFVGLTGLRNLRQRKFLVGFLVSGGLCLAVYTIWAIASVESLDSSTRPGFMPIRQSIESLIPGGGLIVFFAAVAYFTLPQLGFCLANGYMYRKIRNANPSNMQEG